jgi:hypothetical protein
MKSGEVLPTGFLVSTGGGTVLQEASATLNTSNNHIDLFIIAFFISFLKPSVPVL